MPSTQALGPTMTAILSKLRTSVAVTGYVGVRIYPDDNGDAPQIPAYPYVQVETAGERPFNTMGGTPDALKWGSVSSIQIRVGSQSRSDAQANTITGLIKQALDGQTLAVAGYGSVDVSYEFLVPIKDFVSGVTTREWVSTYDVTVHQ